MSKEIFRFLRGEINGFYLTAINGTLNSYVSDIKSFLIKFNNQQFDSATMDSETIYNIGRFASIFLPRRPVSEARTSLYMTESEIVDGEEFSERGLYDTENETFNFEHTDSSITSPDINTLADSTHRSSLVGTEVVEGYIVEGESDVIDDSGLVRPDKVQTTAPSGVAYSDFHGDEFLYLSEGTTTFERISPELYIELVKAMQWIRYNGCSLRTLVAIVEILCPNGLVKIGDISVLDNGNGIEVDYSYDASVSVTLKEQRLSIFQYIADIKFKQIVLVEV